MKKEVAEDWSTWCWTRPLTPFEKRMIGLSLAGLDDGQIATRIGWIKESVRKRRLQITSPQGPQRKFGARELAALSNFDKVEDVTEARLYELKGCNMQTVKNIRAAFECLGVNWRCS